MGRSILAKPVDHFGRLCDTLAEKHDQDAPARIRQGIRDQGVARAQIAEARRRRLLPAARLDRLENILDSSDTVPDDIREALDAAVLSIGATK